MAELLMQYLILAIDNAPDSSPVGYSFLINKPLNCLNLAECHFEMLSGVCIKFCIVSRQLDLLFGYIFHCFYEALFINVFLDVVETYVLFNKLKYIAPEAMVLYVAHCKDMKDLSMVERGLLHMQWKAQSVKVNVGVEGRHKEYVDKGGLDGNDCDVDEGGGNMVCNSP